MKLRILLIVLLLSLLCSSCDNNSCKKEQKELPKPKSDRKNVVWSNHSTTPLEFHFSADYWNTRDRYWVVLGLEEWGMIGQENMYDFVLLCLREEEGSGCQNLYQLNCGLVVRTWFLDNPAATIMCLRVLEEESFRGEENGEIKLFYNGRVSGIGSTRSYDYDDGRDLNWLRFEAVPKENKQKVVSTIEKLYPLLEERSDAREVLACFEPLISDSGNSR